MDNNDGEECNDADEEEKGEDNNDNDNDEEEEGDGHDNGKEGDDYGEEWTMTTGRNV